MNITLNTKYEKLNTSRKPNFTAQLRGSAVRSAIKSAKDTFQLSEISEIIDNINKIGDTDTIINCGHDGLVNITNKKFGKAEFKTKIVKNEKSNNPFLEMLRNFNSNTNIQKYELALFDNIFSHSRNKQQVYNLYSTYSLNPRTRVLFELSASKYPEIKRSQDIGFDITPLEQGKEMLLKHFSSIF